MNDTRFGGDGRGELAVGRLVSYELATDAKSAVGKRTLVGRRTEEERVSRHQAAYGEPLPARGTGFQRLLDPLGMFPRSGGSISNPIPVEFDGRLVDLKEIARRNLVAALRGPRAPTQR